MNSAVAKVQHTPGPWGVEQTDADIWVGPKSSDGVKVRAITAHIDWDKTYTERARQTRLANAHLIAAAPEMYEALKGLIALAESGESVEEPLELIAAGREAIAKAEGRQ